MIQDQTFIMRSKVLVALTSSPHAACKLVRRCDLTRDEIDKAIQFLKRRGLIEHNGAWELTELGRIAVNANNLCKS